MFRSSTVKKKDEDPAHALNAALRLLTRREYSILELYTKLSQKYTKEAVKDALKKCIDNSWQSEERYMEMLFNHLKNQCYGPRKVVMEASKKGVKSEYYQQYLDETDWIEIALTFLNKKIPNDLELTFENKQKYLASLARRGFSTSDCLEAMERYESERFLSN